MPTLSEDDQRRNEFVKLVKYRPVRVKWTCLDDCANRDGFEEGDVVEVDRDGAGVLHPRGER